MTTDQLPAAVPRSPSGHPRRNQDTSWISPRLLLLFSCLLIMISAGDSLRFAWPRVGVLVAAALMTGTALLRPRAVGDAARERRAARAIVGVLLLAGLVMSAGFLAKTIADLASPLWFTVILGYAFLGLAVALPWARRLPLWK